MQTKRLILLICAALLGELLRAEIRLPALFGDGMVLQQQTTVRLWGSSDPGSRIALTTGWDGKVHTCKAAPNGSWALKVRTPEAGGPYEIRIDDGTEYVLRDVLVGEVWVCAGQSNMEMPVRGFSCQPVEGAMELLTEGPNDRLRAFTVGRALAEEPRSACSGRWVAASSATVPGMSAVAYCFARRLQRATGVPVGIVVAAWGGTSILGWMPAETVARSIPAEACERILADNRVEKNLPGRLYNGMIAPIAGFAARGFLWYQGEANVGHADAYAVLLRELIGRWRRDWGDERMPFYAVEITPYRYGRGNERGTERPLLVEAEAKMLSEVPRTALIPTSDAGDQVCIHPARKGLVGERLAATALREVYGFDGLEPRAPGVAGVEFADGRAVVTTTSRLGPSPAVIRGFEIAGPDRRFHAARALVDRRAGTILLSSAQVPDPVAVRYAFRNWIEADWTNWMGIPALPYRSDDWPADAK